MAASRTVTRIADQDDAVSGKVPVALGGTGAGDAATARTNLGLGTAATHPATDFLTPSGNGSALTGITESQVSGLTTDLAAKVQSISLTTPTVIYATPVTWSVTAGVATATLSLNTQTANTMLAGPTTGSAATPTFRLLVAADLPNHSAALLTSGNVALARLGTGTPAAGKYVDGGTGAWTALPAVPAPQVDLVSYSLFGGF